MKSLKVTCSIKAFKYLHTLAILSLLPFFVPSVSSNPIQRDSETSARAEHVVLISVDGLRPEFYLEENWPTPVLQQFIRAGVHARQVRSVFPTVTYPAHTTVITGVLPVEHGIFYNTPFQEMGQSGEWYWQESYIRVQTLWDAVRSAGGSSASVGWPVSVGAPIDFNLPEYWTLSRIDNQVEVLRQVTQPPDLLEEIEIQATGRLRVETFSRDQLVRDDKTADAAAYLLETYMPTILTVHLIEVDYFQHRLGREGDLVRRAVAVADRSIGKLVEAADRVGISEKTAFLVFGDHGFVDVQTFVSPNVWLVEAGLLEDKPDRGEWKAAFHTAGGSAFLYTKAPGDFDAVSRVREVLEEMIEAHPALFRIIDRETLSGEGVDTRVELAVEASKGVAFLNSTEGEAIRPGRGGTHGYWPDLPEMKTGFIAWGAGFKEDVFVNSMELRDIRRLVDVLLGLEISEEQSWVVESLLEVSE